jgi:hypothetical protein
MFSQSTRIRLATQQDVVSLLIAEATPEAVMARPAADQWSAHEHLAHLTRHHAVFLERLEQMRRDHGPHLGRYRAEEDAAWPEWVCLSTEEVLHRLKALRAEIIQHLSGLSEAETTRVGIHPLFGAMSVVMWVEFFLLHEAHHLYMIMTCLGHAKRARRS